MRQFHPSWFNQFPWLQYSPATDGSFCRACAFFAPGFVGGHSLGQFVSSPFKRWRKLSEKANAHGKLSYHLESLAMMSEFLARYENPSQAVDTVLISEAQKRMKENEKVISSLFKVVLLCGKQGIAFCGHRDDGINWEEANEESSSNQGNFIELVRFRAETDEVLSQHLQKSSHNARYTSKTIQNELIEIVGNHIFNNIIEEVKASKFFTLIADEVTDASNHEQLSICLRYVHATTVKEVFVGYKSVERITGKSLADTILKWLDTAGLPLSDMRGQCYDGSSNMSGARSGCSTIIRQQSPMAVYFHCAAHRLNLAVVAACKIQAFKNVEAYIGEIARFFAFSAKRQRFFDRVLDVHLPNAKAQKLKDACRTRWIQRIDSYIVFLELLPALHTTLQAMVFPRQYEDLGDNWSWDSDTVTKANGFLFQLLSPSFLISFKILLEILQALKSLTLKLQMQAIDVIYAYKQVQTVLSSLKMMRERSTEEFTKIFTETLTLGQEVHGEDFELTTPRTVRQQVHRSNPEASSPEQYYRITLYNEFLSHVIRELEERFPENSSSIHGLLYLIPCECVSNSEGPPSQLTQAVNFYKADLPSHGMFSTEYRMWVRKWKQCSSNVPTRIVDTLQQCDDIEFPNISVLLKLALTLPITSCESERSFSQLKLIKTYLRSTMTDTRLNGLAIMKINRKQCDTIQSSPEKLQLLVRSFAMLHPRRMKLSFVLAD